jgi:hypothetical protein
MNATNSDARRHLAKNAERMVVFLAILTTMVLATSICALAESCPIGGGPTIPGNVVYTPDWPPISHLTSTDPGAGPMSCQQDAYCNLIVKTNINIVYTINASGSCSRTPCSVWDNDNWCFFGVSDIIIKGAGNVCWFNGEIGDLLIHNWNAYAKNEATLSTIMVDSN